ncbi:MAG: hypothetical protein ICV85_08380 [Tolypothrix sp. T3-bin4]|nr:hypothetical protein [Tolypothrix sp. T3-bin4]
MRKYLAKPHEDGKFCAFFISLVRSALRRQRFRRADEGRERYRLQQFWLSIRAEMSAIAQALKKLILITFSDDIPSRGQPPQ